MNLCCLQYNHRTLPCTSSYDKKRPSMIATLRILILTTQRYYDGRRFLYTASGRNAYHVVSMD